MAAPKDADVRSVIRGILVSTPNQVTARQLDRDFLEMEGYNIPYSKFGFKTLLDYLRSITDTVSIMDSSSNPVVLPVTSGKSSHVEKLVSKQRSNPSSKRGGHHSMPQRRRPNKESLHMASSQHEPRQPINRSPRIPSIFELKFDQHFMEKLKGAPVFGARNYNDMPLMMTGQALFHTIPQSVNFQPSRSARRNSDCKRPLLEDPVLGKGPQPFKGNSDYGSPLLEDPVFGRAPQLFKANEQRWNHSNSGSVKPPAGASAQSPAQQRDTKENSDVRSWVQNSDANAFPTGAEKDCKSSDTPSYIKDNNKVSSWIKKSSPNICPAGAEANYDTDLENRLFCSSRSNGGSVISDNDCSPISDRMKDNFKILLRRNPDGIFCSELPALYEAEFNAPLSCQDLGYNSIIQMVSDHQNIFSFTRFEKTGDWLLKTRSDFSKTDNSSPPKRLVPKKIIKNIMRVLEHYPGGLPLTQFLQKYKEFGSEPFDFRQYGDSIEGVMKDLENYVHQRRVGNETLLYDASQFNKRGIESKTFAVSPALPDSVKLDILHKDLYPDECCKQDDVIPPRELPVMGKSKFIEVRVSDIETPEKMWFHLGNGYEALQSMMEDLHQFYETYESKYMMPELTIRPRQLCACIFKTDSISKWHRAIILSHTKDSVKVKVEYIDYGTKQDVDRTILRFLHKDFTKLPSQAIEGKLLSVHPPVGCKDWPLASNQHLLAITFERRLVFELVVVNKQKHSIAGFLYDTNGDDDIVINDELVNSGHATMKSSDTENDYKPESPISDPYAHLLNSPIASDQTVPWSCFQNLEDSQTSPSVTSKYYETNPATSYTDSSSSFHTASQLMTDAQSPSPPYIFTSGVSTSGINGSLSPHSSNSPDIIYYGSGDHINNIPSSTPPLSNNLSKYSFPELNRSSRSSSRPSSSPHSCRLSSPLSGSPKSETIVGDLYGTPSAGSKPVEHFNLPFSSTTTMTTSVSTDSVSSELPPKRPPPGFGNGDPAKQVNNLPYMTTNYLPGAQNWTSLGQSTTVNHAPPIMSQPMLPNYSPFIWPNPQTITNYMGLGLPQVYPMFNNNLVNALPAIGFQYRNPNTFVTNPLLQQQYPVGIPHSTLPNRGLDMPATGFNMPAAGLNMLATGLNMPATNALYTQVLEEQRNRMSPVGLSLASPSKSGNSTVETSYSPVKSNLEASKTDLSTSLTTTNKKTLNVNESSLLKDDLKASKIGIKGSHTAKNQKDSRNSVETVTTSKTTGPKITEPTSLVCIDSDSVCSDWENCEEANETVRCVSKDDSESVFSDVETDASVKKGVRSASTSSAQSDCPQTVISSVNNPLVDRSSKPMSRSARKRQRKSMLKNKGKESASTLPVIADTTLSYSVNSTTPGSALVKDSVKESGDSVVTSNLILKSGNTATTDKNKKKKAKNENVSVVAEQSRAKKLASIDTSLRRPRNKDILVEISGKTNSNELKSDQKPSVDEKKNDECSKLSKDLNPKVSQSEKKTSKEANKEVPSDGSSLKSNPSAISSTKNTNVANQPTKSDNKSSCDSLSNEKNDNTLKRKLVQDWKLLDTISKETLYTAVPKPAKENSSEKKEEERESSCDMIDRIISSLGRANVHDKAAAESSHSTLKESVQQKVINSKTVHIFLHNKQPTVCTDEIITSFTKFTKRLAVNKALDCKQAIKPYFDITRKNNDMLFKLLDNCKISGIIKEGETELPDKLSIMPLENVSNLLMNLGAVPSIVDSFSKLFEELNSL